MSKKIDLMQKKNDILSVIQQTLLIPAFIEIVGVLEKKGIKATVNASDDSRAVCFVGKHGKECEYRCHINQAGKPHIYRNFTRPGKDYGMRGEDFSGVFADEVRPETVVEDFQRIFGFHT